MSFTPVQPEEQVQKACQLGLTVLSAPETPIPGNLLDSIQSFKALLNGVIGGQLVICQKAKEKAPKDKAPPKEPVKKKVSAKKG